MPKFTVLIHAEGNASELERTLKCVSFSRDVLVVAVDSNYASILRMAHSLGARVKKQIPGVSPGAYVIDAFYDWVLVVRPGECLDRQSAESLRRWQRLKHDDEPAYAVGIDAPNGAAEHVVRLVNRRKFNWTGDLPPSSSVARDLPLAA